MPDLYQPSGSDLIASYRAKKRCRRAAVALAGCCKRLQMQRGVGVKESFLQ